MLEENCPCLDENGLIRYPGLIIISLHIVRKVFNMRDVNSGVSDNLADLAWEGGGGSHSSMSPLSPILFSISCNFRVKSGQIVI